MAIAHSNKLSVKNIFTALGFIALCIVIAFNKDLVIKSWHLLGNLRWYFVIAVVVVQFVSYWLNAFYYQSILKVFNYSGISIVRLFEAALATNYVNYMVPSIGAAGAGYLSQVLAPEVKRGESVLTQLMRSVLDALALLLMLPIGLILISRQASGSIIEESLISTAIVVFAGLLIFWLVNHENKFRKLTYKALHLIKRLFPRFDKEKAILNFLDSFYTGYRTMFSKKKQMLVPFIWSVLYVSVELLTVYIYFLAFGRAINPGIVIIAYLIANIFSILGGVIFSVGIFELGMAGAFIALGIPPGLAFSITIIYRAFNVLISLPPGFYYYRKYLP